MIWDTIRHLKLSHHLRKYFFATYVDYTIESTFQKPSIREKVTKVLKQSTFPILERGNE